MGRAAIVLAAALLLTHRIWIGRPAWGPARHVLPAHVVAVLVQAVHLVEEYRTAFYARFPPLFGAPAWSPLRFLAFNLTWLAVFAAAGVAIARGNRLGYLAALFLALGGGLANGLGHLALAAATRGYFPGAYTGILSLVAGVVLARQLLRRA